MTDAPDLTTWLTGVLDTIEATARTASPGPWRASTRYGDEWPVVLDAQDGDVVGAETYDMYDRYAVEMEPGNVAHIAMHDPAAVLADIAAERAIIALHVEYSGECECCVYAVGSESGCTDSDIVGFHEDWPCPHLRLIASAYRFWPGFREEWAP